MSRSASHFLIMYKKDHTKYMAADTLYGHFSENFCFPKFILTGIARNAFTRSERLYLFYKAYMLADLLDGFLLALIEDHFIFFKQISSVCVDGYDERPEFLHAAVP